MGDKKKNNFGERIASLRDKRSDNYYFATDLKPKRIL